MPKQKTPHPASFGQRLSALRKAAGYTQQNLADELGVSRRMIAYYEGQSEHPPTTLLPALAQALHISTDELLGLRPPPATKRAGARPRGNRMQRRLQQIENLPPGGAPPAHPDRGRLHRARPVEAPRQQPDQLR